MSETGEHTKAPVTGVVLAGGQSRRMGGGDKGLLELAGKPMLRHVIDRLAPQVGRTIINANGDPQRFATFALPVVADTVEGFVGPLAGVLAGMRWSTGNVPAARWIVTAPGDAPLLPRDLVERMMEAVAEREDTIALAQSGGEMHPVVGLWPIALMQDLEEQLKAGVRKVLIWAALPSGSLSIFESPSVSEDTSHSYAAAEGRFATHSWASTFSQRHR